MYAHTHIRSVLLRFACALVVVLAWPAAAQAAGLADSPWPMAQHDPQHSGRSPYAAPSRLYAEWRAQLNGLPGGPAIAVDGTIYVPTGGSRDQQAGSLYAINPDGTHKWRFQFPLYGLCRQIAGYATPAIADDGTVYVHTQAGYTPAGPECISGDSYLFAINPNGTEKWHFQFNAGAGVFKGSELSSPAIAADGTIYATSADTGLYAIDPADGSLDWVVSPSATSILASPAIGPDGTVYASVFDLHAYEPDGDPKWTADVGGGAPNTSTPSVGADGTVYACFLNPDACHAVSTAGADLWSVPFDAAATTPAIGSDGTIYLVTGRSTDDGRLAAIGPNGTTLWSRAYPYDPTDSPLIDSSGRLYARMNTGFDPETLGLADTIVVLNPDGSERSTQVMPHAGPIGDVGLAVSGDGVLYAPDPHFDGFVYDPDDQHLVAFVQGQRLAVTVAGEGVVTGPGINCAESQPGDCAETYRDGTAVTLQAQANEGSFFAGWAGSCTGTGACQLGMEADRSVTATFVPFVAPKAPFNLKQAIKRCKKKYARGTKARKRCIKKARKKAATLSPRME